MSKQSGLGDALYLTGFDASGDTNSLGRIGGGPAPWPVTGIDKSAFERIGLNRDGALEWVSYFNPALAQAHAKLSALPTTDVLGTYCRGTALGSPAAGIVAKQVNYDGTRGQDGSFTFAVSAQGNGFGLNWGSQLTAGKRTDTGATSGTGVDFGTGSTTFGLQAFLHVFDFTGTDATVKLQQSSDNGVGDTWADVTGGGFTQVTAGPTAQRIATSGAQTVERYLRVVTTTSGGFSSLVFAVMVARNDVATAF
ncbi:hypothetical protein [Catellatospora methionotrophica]|uniref:hypothetical protein n=1 Tax=Catellatospora methionotrophica TaxID=121620 RepID=UPI00140B6F1B|nr:hypothetical protein [Catellatospora methionotrophica]